MKGKAITAGVITLLVGNEILSLGLLGVAMMWGLVKLIKAAAEGV